MLLRVVQSRERTWDQRNYTQRNDTGNISIEPRVRTEADAAYEKMLDSIAGSPATRKTLAGIMNLFVDDLSGTGGTEMDNVSWPDSEKISKLVLKTGMM